MEDAWLGKATERLFLPLLRMMLPELVDYNLPVEGVFHNLAHRRHRQAVPVPRPRRSRTRLWGMGQMMFTKCVVVVDKDVNVHDVAEVAWRVLNNIDPKRDVMISDGPVDVLDHASCSVGFGGKMGIDATAQVEGRGLRARLAGGGDDGARRRGARRSPVERARHRRCAVSSDEPRACSRCSTASRRPTTRSIASCRSGSISRGARRRSPRSEPFTGAACSTSARARSISRRCARERGRRGRRDRLLARDAASRGAARCWCRLVRADALALPFADAHFDGVICGFGLRNLADPRAGLAEMRRVLKPGGRCVVLDFFRPRRAVTRAVQALYNQRVCRSCGGIVSGDRSAYRYLAESIERFATRERRRGACAARSASPTRAAKT